MQWKFLEEAPQGLHVTPPSRSVDQRGQRHSEYAPRAAPTAPVDERQSP